MFRGYFSALTFLLCLLQISVVQHELTGLRLCLSSSRVVGCFMLTNLPLLTDTLQELNKELSDVASNKSHLGVIRDLIVAQALQQDMLAAVKVRPTITVSK